MTIVSRGRFVALNFANARMGHGHVYTELRVKVCGASRLPDVVFYQERPPTDAPKHALRAPDLAVEIRSPTDPLAEQREKCRWWTTQGTRVALLVDPESRNVEFFDADGHRQTYRGSTILPLEGLLPLYGPQEFHSDGLRHLRHPGHSVTHVQLYFEDESLPVDM
jgi:Uma2 family endonuclease